MNAAANYQLTILIKKLKHLVQLKKVNYLLI